MLCGGNTVIMCGTCDMGRKICCCRTHTFFVPPPWGGSPPKKNIPTGIKKFFLPPPLWLGAARSVAAEISDVDPTPPDPLSSTHQVVCVLGPAVVADADLRRLHVGSFGKDHAWRYLKPLMAAASPQFNGCPMSVVDPTTRIFPHGCFTSYH